jgi:3'-phosphoadenosine 5'-phosphosulfate sulfotransferase (PAPS reductase)/FAD synthetase
MLAIKRPTELLPFSSYDHIIISYSGGKDSLAMILAMMESGVDPHKIELWHQAVDGGPGDKRLMDWPCTESYCRATAAALNFPIRFQYKEGGFLGELLRENAPTKGVYYETVQGETRYLAPQGRKLATRRKFPAKSADLQTRWCSGYLKIDVARRVINNDSRFAHSRILFLTGERRQESAARSKYKECEPSLKSTTNRNRRTDQWRCVIDWREEHVWDIIKRHGIIPHPAYLLGWGRVSCMACIFGLPDQWASVRHIDRQVTDVLASYEQSLGHTIDHKLTVIQMADKGTSFVKAPEELRALAMSREYPADRVFTSDWQIPAGAFKKDGGPS